MQDYLQNNSEKYRHALKNVAIDGLHSTIVTCKRWRNLLQQVKDCTLKDDPTESLIPDVKNVVTYSEVISEVTKEINCLKAQLNVEIISDETTKFEGKREEFFRKLRNSLNKLKEIDEKLQDVLLIPVNAKESEENLKTKAKRIGDTLLETASKPQLTQIECDQFRKYYQHLLAIDEHLSLPDVEAKQNLDASKIKVLEKVAYLRGEFIASGTNLEKPLIR
ncbi:unnamed protein product [Didymodactylos carnosus]|uniref:Uncharacterized protein n=1 Tax=Didymodactylos carnosus TaxID=1234261 RepID=A0A8S2Y7B6_9BILA|nr:unnamed protein product [Didymodactylos carnosus]